MPFGWIIVLFLAGCLGSCASSRKTTSKKSTTVDYNSFTDDLSAARPKYTAAAVPPAAKPSAPVPATRPTTRETRNPLPPAEPLHINRRLDAMLDTIAVKNQSIQYAQGYRIQIYVGNERQEAEQAKRATYQNFPELNPYLSYRQPTYRLKVGDFMRRMDAERYLSLLRQQFSSAILLPDRVDIRKSLSIK